MLRVDCNPLVLFAPHLRTQCVHFQVEEVICQTGLRHTTCLTELNVS